MGNEVRYFPQPSSNSLPRALMRYNSFKRVLMLAYSLKLFIQTNK